MRSLFFLFLFFTCRAQAQEFARTLHTDVLVIGGGTGGTAAAIQSARAGVSTLLAEPGPMLGGMLTAAGVSCTDGNDQFAGGMWQEFRQALYQHYGRTQLNSGWVSQTCFEPHAGDSIFKAWAAKEEKLEVIHGLHFRSVIKNGSRITGAVFFSEKGEQVRVKAKVVIDATETGEVFAAAGVPYDLGTDDPLQSGEKEARQKTSIIQDLTWVAVLKDYGPGADKTIARPANYDSTLYFCSTADVPCAGVPYSFDTKKVLNYGRLPNGKYMLNWPAHGNDYYLNVIGADSATRRLGYEKARQHTLGFIYFLQTQAGMKHLGLADDELNNGLALVPYNREGRRVQGVVRMNLGHISNPYSSNLYRTGIAVGDYPVDHHHAKYPGAVPEIAFPPVPAYNIPMGVLLPQGIEGLVVCEKGISVTNIVNGTTRLQPVVLLTGQAAGMLAALSVLLRKELSGVPVQRVQEALLKAKCYLVPFSDVRITDPHWESIQRTGLAGILRGTGKPEGWANKMFFYPDSLVNGFEFYRGLLQYGRFFSGYHRLSADSPLRIDRACRILMRLRPFMKKEEFKMVKTPADLKNMWTAWGLTDFDTARPITRRELAVMVDKCIRLSGHPNVIMDIKGDIRFRYSEF